MSDPINIDTHQSILGIDESGKGDFFGPLVIAGVIADDDAQKKLIGIGARDSKKISNNRVREMAAYIRDNMPYTIVMIGPEKYNQLYSKIRNLNKLLAWGHSRVIENLAEEYNIDLAISDKFGKDETVKNALMERGKKIKLIQRVRAESSLPVAAASIVARAAFVESMMKLSDKFGIQLPLGAGAPVDKTAHQIADKNGPEIFLKIAKTHFKNFKRIQ